MDFGTKMSDRRIPSGVYIVQLDCHLSYILVYFFDYIVR